MINPHYAKLNIMKVELDTKFREKAKKLERAKRRPWQKRDKRKKKDKR